MNETEENRFNEIWTLADLDEAINKIADEDAGWGIPFPARGLDANIFRDIIEPTLFKVVWAVTPSAAHYRELFSHHLSDDAVRRDWGRGPHGVWDVFRCPSLAL